VVGIAVLYGSDDRTFVRITYTVPEADQTPYLGKAWVENTLARQICSTALAMVNVRQYYAPSKGVFHVFLHRNLYGYIHAIDVCVDLTMVVERGITPQRLEPRIEIDVRVS
jgi:hypothetical protein